jgi:NADPH-dependent curcumin reductase CurA
MLRKRQVPVLVPDKVTCIMQVKTKSREIRLASRPAAWPAAENFELGEVELGEPEPGQVLVRITHSSVEPYMRGRMNDVKSYVPPFAIGKPLQGGAVGFVVSSADESLPVGTWVHSMLGWREYALAPAGAFTKIDVSLAPPSAYLGVLGVPGMTAWVGLTLIAGLKAGETIFISSAAGAVGSIAGQLAKLKGATVIGSAGGAEKVAFLTEKLGYDAGFDHVGGDIDRKLREAAPDGIDVYFDNVGGEQLEAAITALRPFGRIAACGMISGYNEAQPGPRNIIQIVGKRLRMQGFIVSDNWSHFGEFVAEIGPELRAGKIHAQESFVDGVENAPEAFIDMLRGGKHIGKVIVRTAPEGTVP